MSEKNIIHPKITAIQNHINNANDYWRKKTYVLFMVELDLTIMELFPEDQPNDIVDLIHKEQITLESITYPGQKNKRLSTMKWKYREWFLKLQKHIASCGYFENKKYGSAGFDVFKDDENFTDE